MATFTVTTAADAGAGSLRNVITQANAASGNVIINFSIGSGLQTINLASPLPALTRAVLMNGQTQPGYAGDPLIEIRGGGTIAGDGLRFNAGGEVVSLIVNGFDDPGAAGIRVGNNVTSFVMRDCYVGTNAAGTAAVPNSIGVHTGTGGLDINIGTLGANEANVISGNLTHGVVIDGADIARIQGCRIGTTADGMSALGNGFAGVTGDFDNGIVRNNVISGNASLGLLLAGDNNVVTANNIGVALDGTTPLGNNTDPNAPRGGLGIQGANNTIGGTGPFEANIIANNAFDGVALGVAAGAGNTIRGNVIYGNGGLGINLAAPSDPPSGVTPNDPGDADTGPNNFQNYPVITAAHTFNSGSAARVTGTLNSAPNTSYTVDVYASNDGEGKTLLGTVNVMTNPQGNGSFTLDYGPTPGQGVITATATGPAGSTSEFSLPVTESPNVDPLANVDSYTIDEDQPLMVNPTDGVLANDTDGNGDQLTVTLVDAPISGHVQLHPDGAFEYMPDPDYFGNDGFTYEVSDGISTSISAVNITINPVPDAGKFSFSASEFFATENDGNGMVTVLRTGGMEGIASVDYTIAPGTATESEDYFGFDGTLTFFPGEIAQDIFIGIASDLIPETSETLTVSLSNPTGGATFPPGPPPMATLTIANSDAPPSIFVNDPEPVVEGNPGDANVIPFVFNLTEASDDLVTVHYSFGFGSATAGEDFDDAAVLGQFGFGTVTIAPGETTATVLVPIIGDTENEFDESLSISLFGVTNATLSDSFAFGVITNDDNQLPTAANQTITRAPGAGPLTLDLTNLVTSPDGDVLALSIETPPLAGIATVDKHGTPFDVTDDTIVYVPDGLGFIDDSFTYGVTDPYGGQATGVITIESRGMANIPNPNDPSKTDLLVAATPDADEVRLVRSRVRGEFHIMMDGVDQGAVSPTGRIIIEAGDGDDVIDARGLNVGVTLIGGDGNDTIRAGRGVDLIIGGPGDDVLVGGQRRDILIGGAGKDRLAGGANDDLLIAGTVTFAGDDPESQQFRTDLIEAWNATGDRDGRLDAIAAGTLDSGVFLDSTNVLDDDAKDFLSGNAGGDWFFAVSDPDDPNRDRFNATFGEDDFTELA